MIALCVKCQAVNDFTQALDYCYKCGATNPAPSLVPYDKVEPFVDHKTKRGLFRSVGKYWNCEREPHFLHRGLCSACRNQVSGKNGHPKPTEGSERYYAILKEYREKRWPEKFRKAA